MKCKQKLCNRNKNLCTNGNCNVCDEAIKEVFKQNQKENPKKPIEEIHVDLEAMVKTHEKLLKGELVDPKDVSALLLAGVIKILNQHDTIDKLEDRMKKIECQSLTNKFRTESMENWVVHQGETIKDLEEKLLKFAHASAHP